MTKKELSQKVAARSNMTAAEVREVLELSMDVIKETVSTGNGVYLRGFGTFISKRRAEKKARNISKGTEVIIPAHNVPSFKPSRAFRVK